MPLLLLSAFTFPWQTTDVSTSQESNPDVFISFVHRHLRFGPITFRLVIELDIGHDFDGDGLELEVKMGFGTSKIPAEPDEDLKAAIDAFLV